ncbi:hypothetical protein ACHAW5_002956 [Stephanodiscus triporus]|uniref:Uncharacterized protein n=1 Tax=Stephanodiscus triporus TaxID=2934178 RepID=A0ABD3PF65_9STRA
MPSGYEPRIALLRGIAVFETTTTGGGKGEDDNEDDDGEDNDAMENARDAIGRGGLERRWRYFPEAGLPSDVALRIGSMFALRDAWTAEEATPYLERFVVVASSSDREGGGDYGNGSGRSTTTTTVADLLGRHARATTAPEGGKIDVSVVKYVAKR